MLLSNHCRCLDTSICVKYMHREGRSEKLNEIWKYWASVAKTQKREPMMPTPVLTQQRRKPVDIGFTVRVQKGDDFSFGLGGAQKAGPDQPLPLLGPQNANFWQPHHVLVQRYLQMLWGDTNSSCNDWWQTQEHSRHCANIRQIQLHWYESATSKLQPNCQSAHTGDQKRGDTCQGRMLPSQAVPLGKPHHNTPA